MAQRLIRVNKEMDAYLHELEDMMPLNNYQEVLHYILCSLMIVKEIKFQWEDKTNGRN